MWKEIVSGLSSWAKEFGSYVVGTHPSAKTLSPFDDPALTPVRLVLDPLHVAKPFLGLLAKSGALDRPFDPISLTLSGLVGREGIEEAKKAPDFTEAGERMIGSNPFSQLVFLGIDVALPGPGEIGKVSKLATRMGDAGFSQIDQLKRARDTFQKIGIPTRAREYVSTPERVATLLDSQLWEEIEDLDLAASLAKTYQDLEEQAFRLPGDPLANLRSLAEEKARELYQAYQRAVDRNDLAPSDAEAKVLGLLVGLEWMSRGPRPWRWLNAFENKISSNPFLGTPADRMIEIYRPRFLQRSQPLSEIPLAYGPNQIENLLEISDYPALASIDLPLQLASWAQRLSPEEAMERLRRYGSLFGTAARETWEDLAFSMAKDQISEGIDSLGEIVGRIGELDPTAGIVMAERLAEMEKLLLDRLESGKLRDALRAVRGLRKTLSQLLLWVENSAAPLAMEIDERWRRIWNWIDDLTESYLTLEKALWNVQRAIDVANQIDGLARFAGSRPGGWEDVRRVIDEEIVSRHRGPMDWFLEGL